MANLASRDQMDFVSRILDVVECQQAGLFLIERGKWEPKLCKERDCPLDGFQHWTDECVYYLPEPEIYPQSFED